MEIFNIKNLTYYYPNENFPALNNINLSVKKGEFILMLGKSGSGKSTLARIFNGIIPEFYGGRISGEIISRAQAGMLFQDPEKQMIMDKIEREIAFGLENECICPNIMKKKVDEVLDFLNIKALKDKNTYQISGGQQQKVALGAAIAVQPKLLVLDEPTSQLDNISAEEILEVVKRLNKELGYTVILIEHRIDRCFHLADRIIYIDSSEIAFDGTPKEFVDSKNEDSFLFMPSVSQFFKKLKFDSIPYTLSEGLKQMRNIKVINNYNSHVCTHKKETMIKVDNLKFAYSKEEEALKGVDMTVYKGDVFGVIGKNGSGKSTLLKNISNVLKPTHGECKVNGKIGFLSQNPNDYLFSNTVYEELKFTLDNNGISDYSVIDSVLDELSILEYKSKNPRDLSGGEKQRVALASILVMNPDILIMDEPTRGLDKSLLNKLGDIILKLKEKQKTIVVVTHDIDFIAKYCNSACVIDDGKVIDRGNKHEVLENSCYKTTMNKLFNSITGKVLTLEDALKSTELNSKIS